MTAHQNLIDHEVGHALVGMLSGLRVRRVHAPPPPDLNAPPPDPSLAAGFVEFERGGEPRARALALLGGPLAEGKPAPAWPLEPGTDDERQLKKLVGEGDELSYLELVREAEETVADDGFVRMHQLASELVAHEPHELNGMQLDHIRRMAMNLKQVDFPTRVMTAAHKRASDRVEGLVTDLLFGPIDTPIKVATFEC